VDIRTASTDDAEAIGRVHALSRGAAYAGLVPAEALATVTPTGQAEVWRVRLAEAGEHAERAACFVAEEDGEVVGFTFGSASGGTAELHAIHLLPDRWGSGVGQALHDRLLEEMRAWGCTRAELCVLTGNERAQAFYRRHGWVTDGAAGEHDIGGATMRILTYRRGL
jgi:GNAT superfamily N-acetyltransferase